MNRIYICLVFSTVVLFSFQNCERPPYKDSHVVAANSTANFTDENIQKVTFQSSENTSVQQSNKTYTLISLNSYAVYFDTGEVLKSIQFNGTTQRFCLKQNLLNELRDILKTAQV